MLSISDAPVPEPLRSVLRGVGQVFFQENALTGGCFLVGIALSSPLMALGGAVGVIIGTAAARRLKFDESEVTAGIYGFNSTLVGSPRCSSSGRGDERSLAARRLRRGDSAHLAARNHVPFPTYTAPFIVTTWVLFFLGKALSVSPVEPGGPRRSRR